MTTFSEPEKTLADVLQGTRNLLRLSITEYSQLFQISNETTLDLEQGVLPNTLDDKIFKILLANIAMSYSPDLLVIFLAAAQKKFPNLKLDSPTALFTKLFVPNLTEDLSQFPWISSGTRFRCRLLQLTDQANGILLWAEDKDTHHQLVSICPSSSAAYLNLIDNYTVIFIPSIYLFLRLNTTKSQLPVLLTPRFNEKLPIGLSIPQEAFPVKSPSQLEVEQTPRRLLIYSPDSYSIAEIQF
jgi:hypothetical protein